MEDPVEELRREQRDRRVLVVAVVIGIVASAACGVAFALGAFGSYGRGAEGMRAPGAIVFFVAPLAVCSMIGYLLYRWRQRRSGDQSTR